MQGVSDQMWVSKKSLWLQSGEWLAGEQECFPGNGSEVCWSFPGEEWWWCCWGRLRWKFRRIGEGLSLLRYSAKTETRQRVITYKTFFCQHTCWRFGGNDAACCGLAHSTPNPTSFRGWKAENLISQPSLQLDLQIWFGMCQSDAFIQGVNWELR